MAPRLSVSVIIATFNRCKFIGASLDSIFAQTRKPDQIIVVDDGSSDGTADALRPYLEQISYIYKTNGGKASALNLAMRRATGSHIWIFDDDDIAHPHALAIMTETLERKACSFVFGSYVTFSSNAQLARLQQGLETKDVEENGTTLISIFGLWVALMFRNFIMQPGLLVRKECYGAMGEFDEKLVRAQDYDMLLRLTRNYKGYRVDDILFYQRHHRGQRGSVAAPVAAGQINEAWVFYEKAIFERVYRKHRLDEFLPPDRAALAHPDSTARFIRGSVMARRQHWDESAKDFQAAIVHARDRRQTKLLPVERAAIHEILDNNNTGLTSIVEANALIVALDHGRGRLRRDIQAAFLFPLPYVLRICLNSGSYAKLKLVLQIYLRFSSPLSLAQAVLTKAATKISSRKSSSASYVTTISVAKDRARNIFRP